ncbi:MAG: UDP-2,4-diacetamido-2,4,6-trideoxy-beta-L-altropyranose hydrolase [Oceanotoga sp.]|uniref:UDP-2,4-diacetamido-2,4, 6-trideoxy-beta-L-altropyranose hydrolase n=1 Tax=Oceanotoga sp. TaxID=2108366 RepID=UPI00264DC998|nr:UDP-2,4-diacetamido-2,4,6-trideoxy-beta-L-altropyranose hydrolase [Oceanotoga sp.]MDN5341369.1 UDP-2,4-diacetamido-2,4,6-trideoxy-beta-L-altropyranose hydrolase [Oceanotoga sp.]
MKIVFRTNGGKNIGLGHVYRCLSLAKAIKDENKKVEKNDIEIIFISNKETIELIQKNNYKFISSDKFNKEDIQTINDQKTDIIIFDSYLANDGYLKHLKQITKLIIFDDNNDIYNSEIPDVIINGNIHAKKLNYSNKEKHFLGPNYLVMREEYWYNSEKTEKSKQKESLMITTGGADFNQIMIKFIQSLKELKMNKKIIIGPMYEKEYIQQIEKEIENDDNYEIIYKPKSLKNYIQSSDYILTAAGSTIYEIMTLNKTPIIYTLADNQKLIAKELEDYGIKNLGNYDKINYYDLEKDILKITSKENTKIKRLFNLFDGQGAKRIAKEIIGEI